MNGRPSLEKAKAIKERRDLEKELGKCFSLSYCPVSYLLILCIVSQRMSVLLNKLSQVNPLQIVAGLNRVKLNNQLTLMTKEPEANVLDLFHPIAECVAW